MALNRMKETEMAVLNYVELPVASTGASAQFYEDAFGWAFAGYGPDYAALEGVPCEIGLNGTANGRSANILPVIEVDDIETAHAAVVAAGGAIEREIFSFPGGRRFHFVDPDGLELAVYVKEG
jgi:predicted enzyme related to lactoylglutathione lyase